MGLGPLDWQVWVGLLSFGVRGHPDAAGVGAKILWVYLGTVLHQDTCQACCLVVNH
jgi:hypothetical protein